MRAVAIAALAFAASLTLVDSSGLAEPTYYSMASQQAWPAGEVPQGIGVRVDPEGIILTAAHVLAGCRAAWAESAHGRVPLELLGLDATADLAVLQSDGRLAGPILGLIGVGLSPGEQGRVFTPDGTEVLVTAVGERGAQEAFVPVLRAGLSGSPVVSARGLLVGITLAVDNRETFVVGPETITRFLRYYKVTGSTPGLRRLPHWNAQVGKSAADWQIAHTAVFRVVCS